MTIHSKTENTDMPRKEREFLRHRREIMQTALALFSQKGFYNVTMQEIAKASEFAVGTLYKFFANKEELYKALIQEKSIEFHEQIKAALDRSDDEMDKIKAWLEEKFRLFTENADLVKLYFAETTGISYNLKTGLDRDIRQRYEMNLERLEKIFKTGIEKGIFPDIHPYSLALGLEGIANALLLEHIQNPDQSPINAQLIATIFFDKIYLKS